MSHKLNSAIAAIGIDIGKNSFHVVGHDKRGAITLRQKWSRGQVEARLANLPPCLIGMEACVGAHHLSRKLQMLGHDAPKQSSWEGGRRKPGLRDASIYVRYASNTDRIDASQQNVARCHKRL